MKGYVGQINKETADNTNFRRVLFTGAFSQLVVMNLKPGEEIGMEVHNDVDQFLRIEAGEGKAILDGEEHPITAGSAVVVAAGVEHNFLNTSDAREMKLYTIYSPAEHPEGTVHRTKAEADAAEHH